MTNWFDSILGVALHEAEEGVISTILPTRYYDVVAEVGPGRVSTLAEFKVNAVSVFPRHQLLVYRQE